MKISVVIPAYNIDDFISRAIESVLRQTKQADEIIVVDDGSTDGSGDTIAKYADKVNYIRQMNKGLSGARNTGIRMAKYDWVAFLDGDDEWLAEHLQRQVELLERNPDLVWSTANYYRCLCTESRQAAHQDPNELKKRLAGKDYFEDYLNAFIHETAGHVDAMVIRKDVLIEAGMFLEGLARAEDMDMWFRIAYRYPKIGFVAEPSVIYHLERSGCLSRQFTPVELYADLLDRQLAAAKEAGRLEAFIPVVKYLLRRWMRSMLFEGRAGDIKKLERKFADVLSRRRRLLINILTLWPNLTTIGCHGISFVVRKLKVRKQLERRPRPMELKQVR